MKPGTIAGILLALALGGPVLWRGHHRPRIHMLQVESPQPADGRFHRVALLTATNGIATSTGFLATGLPAHITSAGKDTIELAVQSPVLPGERTLHIALGKSQTTLHLSFVPSNADSAGDGTLDFLRLHTAADRNAFRAWFTSLAESAADLPSAKLPHEIDDCAALLRWCYRNALHAHDETWLSEAPPTLDLSQPSVRQYAYPLTPLGPGLFRIKAGSFTAADAVNGSFAQFSDAQTLWRLNTFFLSRNIRTARPGDLLFFRQLEQNSPYHSMIVTGSPEQSVIYHTGPIASGPGEIRRVLLRELLIHPDPRWRPSADNTNFLGVYRWNILQEDPR